MILAASNDGCHVMPKACGGRARHRNGRVTANRSLVVGFQAGLSIVLRCTRCIVHECEKAVERCDESAAKSRAGARQFHVIS